MAKGGQVSSIHKHCEVCEMQNAETVLGIIRERGKKGLPLEDVYRQLYNQSLYIRAYDRIGWNNGAMTPGVTEETVDGMSLERIQTIVEALKYERYQWTPVRRKLIPKKGSGKMRPLGIPTWSDKLLQEVIRSLLEAYYEPRFSPLSHGFRPQRGCHTALSEICPRWRGTKWFIEGDITKCFDSLDHKVLMSMLSENIHDNRFLRLIENLLKAGYLENWKYHKTLSGSPQGGIVSPLLSNVYLDKLDKFVETALLPAYNKGKERRLNPAYWRINGKSNYLKGMGRIAEAIELKQMAKSLPSGDPNDPNFRRLYYVRYADDFLLGFNGPRYEAVEIKQQIGHFLKDELKLELSEEKTLITHAHEEEAKFLGYNIKVMNNDTKRDQYGNRSINGGIMLKVPHEVIKEKCRPYLRNGKPLHLRGLANNSDFTIIAELQSVYRGIAEYYQLAHNRHTLGRLRGVMQEALTKTLAFKLKTSVPKVYRQYSTRIQDKGKTWTVLQAVIEREGKKPLVARWGGISLARKKSAILNDKPLKIFNTSSSEYAQRLLADECEVCGEKDRVQVHHVRALKDLHRRHERPLWVELLAARKRKTIAVCHPCHVEIHAGTPRNG